MPPRSVLPALPRSKRNGSIQISPAPHYESLDPWPLEEIINKDVRFCERVEKNEARCRQSLMRINVSLPLSSVAPEAFEYRLGSRSALEWVIDHYQVKRRVRP